MYERKFRNRSKLTAMVYDPVENKKKHEVQILKYRLFLFSSSSRSLRDRKQYQEQIVVIENGSRLNTKHKTGIDKFGCSCCFVFFYFSTHRAYYDFYYYHNHNEIISTFTFSFFLSAPLSPAFRAHLSSFVE